jgi:hypothetical protein
MLAFFRYAKEFVSTSKIQSTVIQYFFLGLSKNNPAIFHNIYKLQKHVLLRHQSYLIVFMGYKKLRF